MVVLLLTNLESLTVRENVCVVTMPFSLCCCHCEERDDEEEEDVEEADVTKSPAERWFMRGNEDVCKETSPA